MSIRSILVPVDGSDHSAHAVGFAATLAEAIGAQVTVMHVFDASAVSLMGMAMLTGKEVDDAIERVSRACLDKARHALGNGALEVKTVAEIGHPSETIVEYAARNPVDMIIMGSRGMSSVKAILAGSVSEQVVRHAPCPVTVVPSPKVGS